MHNWSTLIDQTYINTESDDMGMCCSFMVIQLSIVLFSIDICFNQSFFFDIIKWTMLHVFSIICIRIISLLKQKYLFLIWLEKSYIICAFKSLLCQWHFESSGASNQSSANGEYVMCHKYLHLFHNGKPLHMHSLAFKILIYISLLLCDGRAWLIIIQSSTILWNFIYNFVYYCLLYKLFFKFINCQTHSERTGLISIAWWTHIIAHQHV